MSESGLVNEQVSPQQTAGLPSMRASVIPPPYNPLGFQGKVARFNGGPVGYKLLPLQVAGDRRGKLVSIESMRNVPFDIKRVYYIFDTLPDEERGKHAHRNLEQLVIAMDGACQFVIDDGTTREEIWLNRPDVGLYIGKNIWREMRHFSYGCKLVVLASEYYDEKEYIRNYEEFIQCVK